MQVDRSIKNIAKIHKAINELIFECSDVKTDPMRNWEDTIALVAKMVNLDYGYEITSDHEDMPCARFYSRHSDNVGSFDDNSCDQRVNICMAALIALGWDIEEFCFERNLSG